MMRPDTSSALQKFLYDDSPAPRYPTILMKFTAEIQKEPQEDCRPGRPRSYRTRQLVHLHSLKGLETIINFSVSNADFRHRPYDRGKIPLLCLHGLISSYKCKSLRQNPPYTSIKTITLLLLSIVLMASNCTRYNRSYLEILLQCFTLLEVFSKLETFRINYKLGFVRWVVSIAACSY